MQKLAKLPRNVWVLGFVSLMTDISSEMIYALLPLFLVSELGATVLTVGAIEGLAETTASLVKIWSGALSDYWGRRKELAVLGYGLSTVVKPLFSLASSPLWVLVARFGDRVGKGIRGAPRDALIADSTAPEQRGAAYGLRQSLDTVGAVLGPVAAFAIMAAFNNNFRLVFGLAVIPGGLAVLILALGIRERPGSTVRPLRSPLLTRSALANLGQPYWNLVAVALLFNLGNSSEAFLLLRAQQIGIPAAFIPLTLGWLNGVYALSAYPIGVLSDRIGRTGLLISSFWLYALTYLGFAYSQAVWQIWVLLGLYGLYLGMSQGLLVALVADRVPADQRGTAFGGLNLATGIALLPASLVGGALWDNVGATATFLVGAGFALLAALLLMSQTRQAAH
jgi:MFS family permease